MINNIFEKINPPAKKSFWRHIYLKRCMTKTYSITYNPERVESKPKKYSNEMNRHVAGINVPTGITINQFAEMVSAPNSHSWFGGTYSNSISNQTWMSTQVFGLDFDGGDKTPEETIHTLQTNGINPQLWYSTFSSTPEIHKYRVVLFAEKPITDIQERDLIYKGLLQMVPYADTSCKNAGRIFFGGKEAVVLNTNPTSNQQLIDATYIAAITADKGRTRFIPECIFPSNNAENGEFLSSTSRNNLFSPEFYTTPTTIMGGVLPTIDWKKAQERVKVLDAFLTGEWLYHDQLFGLATNLIYIKGGQRLMKETMQRFNEEGRTHYSENNFNIITYLKKVHYPAKPIHSFSPYEEDADLHDLYSAVVEVRGRIEVIEPIKKMPLLVAEQTFQSKFHKLLNKPNDNGIYLFKVPTAIGKTELLTNLTATLAFPTHALKCEVQERMTVPNVLSPDALHFLDDKLNSRLKYFYAAGLVQKTTAMIHEVANSSNTLQYDPLDIKQAQVYLEQLKLTQESENTVLTTHARALHLTHQHDTVIFDEDPLETMLPIQTAQISDLVKIQLRSRKLFGNLKSYIEDFSNAPAGISQPTPRFTGDPEELIHCIPTLNVQTNVIGLLTSSYFIKDARDNNTLHYIQQIPLPSKQRIVILSATAPTEIYHALYGDRLHVIELTDVEQEGTIIQHTKQSCSRNAMNRYADSLSQKVGDLPVITFKRFRTSFKNPVEDMYFGNCSGYDNLKGKDLAVVGTPHRNNVFYHLIAAQINGANTTNHSMNYQKVEYNGFRFKFTCFDDPLLRNIQLSLIESDLIQAVGRARVLRTNATVQVYSNFPLRATTKFIY